MAAFEIREELQIREDVLAFGFRGGRLKDGEAFQLISGELLASVQAAENGMHPSLVILDMRQVEFMSSLFTGKLTTLNNVLSKSKWTLVLFGLPRELQDIISLTRLDRPITLASDENELRLLVARTTARPYCATDEPSIEFSAEELGEMIATGITLDDVIRDVEQLRGGSPCP